MRLKGINQCSEGEVLGKTILDELGRPLIVADVKLTRRLLEKLKHYGIHVLYIKDEETEDIEVEDSIPLELKQQGISTIRTAFEKVANSSKLDRVLHDHIQPFQALIKTVFKELLATKKALHMITSLQVFDHYLFQHSFNVMVYAIQLMIHLRQPQKSIEEIALGALLHDIGKMKVDRAILDKPGKLSAEEFDVMKEHTRAGFDMLRQYHVIPLVSAHCAFQHHERLDGSGYPRALQDVQIHYYAKILAVADVFDAATTHRVYKKALLPNEGMELLYAGSGKLFEQDIVDAFKRCIALYPEGIEVKLSNGEQGIVKKNDPYYPGRPVVKILRYADGEAVSGLVERDLRTDLSVTITGCQNFN